MTTKNNFEEKIPSRLRDKWPHDDATPSWAKIDYLSSQLHELQEEVDDLRWYCDHVVEPTSEHAFKAAAFALSISIALAVLILFL